MNSFAHGRLFLDDPYFLAGTAVPDWLALVDRRVRVRPRQVLPLADDRDPIRRRIARGILQHHRDDQWFHASPAFNELCLEFSVQLREVFSTDNGWRVGFIAHILIEMLLDSELLTRDPRAARQFYHQLATVDPERIAATVNAISPRNTDVLAGFVPRFVREAYIFDYVRDESLVYRLNRILDRLQLELLPSRFSDWLPTARVAVRSKVPALLPPVAANCVAAVLLEKAS